MRVGTGAVMAPARIRFGDRIRWGSPYGLYRDDGTPIIENGRHDDATSLSAVLFYPDG